MIFPNSRTIFCLCRPKPLIRTFGFWASVGTSSYVTACPLDQEDRSSHQQKSKKTDQVEKPVEEDRSSQHKSLN